jgi:3-oxoacyl-[acyl-carrier-protein] synthase-3
MKRAGIVGLGLWVPSTIRRNDAWPPSFSRDFLEQQRTRRARDFTVLDGARRPYDELYVRHATAHEADPFKGAIERRVADADVPVSHGDAEAARSALADARIDPRDVDLVLSSALVQDRIVPGNGPAIQHLTGCVNAAGIGVESYCSAALSQLDLASALVEAGRARYVLCAQSHQIGRVNDLSVPFSPMFGDASAAFVVGEVPPGRGVVHTVRAGDGSLAGAVTFEYCERPGAVWWRDALGSIRPGTEDLDGARHMGRNMLAYAIDTITQLCEEARVPVDGVSAVCTMQPLVWFQRAVADGLRISPERVPSTYERLAHIGGAGVVANLLEARRRGLLVDGAHVVLFAHGAGLTRYATLLRWSRNGYHSGKSASRCYRSPPDGAPHGPVDGGVRVGRDPPSGSGGS